VGYTSTLRTHDWPSRPPSLEQSSHGTSLPYQMQQHFVGSESSNREHRQSLSRSATGNAIGSSTIGTTAHQPCQVVTTGRCTSGEYTCTGCTSLYGFAAFTQALTEKIPKSPGA